MTENNTNFRTSTLTRYVESSENKAAVLASSKVGDFNNPVKIVTDEKEASITVAMKVVFWMAKEDISITKFKSFMEFLEELECPNMKGLNVAKNVSYTSDKAAVDMLASVIRRDLQNQISRSPFISILCDESTDIASTDIATH